MIAKLKKYKRAFLIVLAIDLALDAGIVAYVWATAGGLQ
jgi:hypothetical protein